MHTASPNKNCATHLQRVLVKFWPLTIVPQHKFTFIHLADELFHECKEHTISAILRLWEAGGNEQARCYRVSPSNNKLLVHTFYFSLHICGKGGRGVPHESGLPGVYHLLTDYIGGGG